MKFIAPEVEVLKFNVSDVLTTSEAPAPSDDATAAMETWVSILGQPCSGNASDNELPDCI